MKIVKLRYVGGHDAVDVFVAHDLRTLGGYTVTVARDGVGEFPADAIIPGSEHWVGYDHDGNEVAHGPVNLVDSLLSQLGNWEPADEPPAKKKEAVKA